jgi:RHS repeat-associated protein
VKASGGPAHFASYDGNGNITALLDGSTGLNSATYEYGPFGESIRVTGTMGKANPFRWSTKFTDDDTDLVYYGYRYYHQSAGHWISRDPLEESGGPNLYAFVFNSSINSVDGLGLFLAAIDGTGSRKWLQIDPRTGRFNSHVRNFYEDYTGPGGKRYWHGPNLVGGGVGPIVDEVYNKICEALRANPKEDINIVGHSRGGLVAILVAKKLKEKPCACENKIKFMGLYDAVDRYLLANTGTIPDNVEYVVHARRDPGVNSRPTFGNTGTSGGKSYVEKFFWATHGGAGGDPWGGDHPSLNGKPTITQEQDEQGSKDVDEWIRSHFNSQN